MVLPTKSVLLNKRLSREEANLLQPLLNEVSNALLLFNKYSREILEANELFLSFFGYDRSQLIGSNVDSLFYLVEDSQLESKGEFPLEAQEILLERTGNKIPVNVKHLLIESNLSHLTALIITGFQNEVRNNSSQKLSSPYASSAAFIESLSSTLDSTKIAKVYKDIFFQIFRSHSFVIFEEIPGEDELIPVIREEFDNQITEFFIDELSKQDFSIRIFDKQSPILVNYHNGYVAAFRERGLQKTIIVVVHIPKPSSIDELKDRLHLVSSMHLFASNVLTQDKSVEQTPKSHSASIFTEELNFSIQNAIQDGIISVSPDRIVRDINTSAANILGYSEDDARNMPIENILIGSDLITSALNLASSGKDTDDLGTVNLHRRDGDLFPAQVKTYPVPQSDGKFSILIFLKDLTEYESTRERMEHLERRAVMGNLSSVFAHEVRNPVNNISTGLQNLAEDAEDQKSKDFINKLRGECNRITRLMDATLIYTKTQEYNYDEINLQALFNFFIERHRHKFVKFNVIPKLNIHEETPKISGDRLSLERVFSNIMNNALNAMEEYGGGILAINIYPVTIPKGKPGVQIDFSDNGPGIPKENLDKIFEPFFTTNPSGTGLGLAISRQTITAHKGSIQVDSFPGGTVFKIILPALPSPDANVEDILQ